jgi:cardiolipin synthase A/B
MAERRLFRHTAQLQPVRGSEPETVHPRAMVRLLADQAFARASGAPLVAGNAVRLLRDARENYPAWLDAIRGARRHVHFENYIVLDDEVGWEFVRALAEKAREGVTVRVVHDWLGSLGKSSRSMWDELGAAGAEVRVFNPPRVDSPFGWLNRDHRKTLMVDAEVGFVSGLCVGRPWVGDPARGLEPWRDTGLELRGPAVADLEWAFADVWEATGRALSWSELPTREELRPAGEVMCRVIGAVPNALGVYRLDQLIASLAREKLWLTDAYFAATSAYVQALQAAARDDVDVRLLVPGTTDIRLLKPFSRATYRPLLEAGVRVFEWNGSMLHAKTAVADGRWARVGSTNLNVASWIGNWELDVAIEDETVALEMHAIFEHDLGHATEIVLDHGRVHPLSPRPMRPQYRPRGVRPRVGARRAAANAIGLGSAVGAALTNRRRLGPAEARLMAAAATALLLVSAIALWLPQLITVPLAVIAAWVAITLFLRAYRLRWPRVRRRRALSADDTLTAETTPSRGTAEG